MPSDDILYRLMRRKVCGDHKHKAAYRGIVFGFGRKKKKLN